MATLLARNAERLVTMDGTRREIAGGGLFARDGMIEQVGPSDSLPRDADEVIDLSGHVVVPGLVNTHHHLYQNLTRAVPAAQDALLFGWLRALYPVWARMVPDDIRVSATVGLAELALSGCTTSADHLYLFPNGSRLDDEIEAALEIGLRLHATRGAMSIGESAGGLPPDSLVEPEARILKDCERVVGAFHDSRPGAMVRIALAPCSPFSVSRELMRDTALLARKLGVMLHTHLAENEEDVAYSRAQFGCRPGLYAEQLGWTGDDVWHAHAVRLDAGEIDLFARSGTGVAHCPCSNMRLGSGIAPVRRMRDAGVKVGLGVDGSASNDAADLLNEARQAMLLQRVALGADAMSAREALEIATLGGARTLGRDDLGSLERGKRADFAAFAIAGPGMAGAWDPVAALVLCAPGKANYTVVEGRVVVREGRLETIDLEAALRQHRARTRRLVDGA
ncbi:8-oxoguanine deaminase [Oceanibacterium hippocampi]|uniref:8-oxoguanine deaminase n=1 Tax=Oceanibacterium hippocampi TaxID=745714 RepID=A0A1Y5U363_9PROT|nr:8-oxoguanine deaminase [Oceanibacterium hippocampi]SLN76045.1 8-oxoguanine deaminase [Oceanibacterium hippocampi]